MAGCPQLLLEPSKNTKLRSSALSTAGNGLDGAAGRCSRRSTVARAATVMRQAGISAWRRRGDLDMKRIVIFGLVAALAGCATSQYRPIVDLQGADPYLYEEDLADCQSYARQVRSEE